MKMPNRCTFFMEPPLIANGAEITRIGGGIKIGKNRTKITGASIKYQYLCRIVTNEARTVFCELEGGQISWYYIFYWGPPL
jgi:hypothetical protein